MWLKKDSILYAAGDFSDITTAADPGNPATRDGIAAAVNFRRAMGVTMPSHDIKTILIPAGHFF